MAMDGSATSAVAEQEMRADDAATNILTPQVEPGTTEVAVAEAGRPDSSRNPRNRSRRSGVNLFKPDFPGFEVCVMFVGKRYQPVRIEVAVDGGARTAAEVGGVEIDALVYQCDGAGDWAPLLSWLQANAVGNPRFRAALRYIAAGDPGGWVAECTARRERQEQNMAKRQEEYAKQAEERARREAEEKAKADREWENWKGRYYKCPYGGVWRVLGSGKYASVNRKWVVERQGSRRWHVSYQGELWGYFERDEWGNRLEYPGYYLPFETRYEAMVEIGEMVNRGFE